MQRDMDNMLYRVAYGVPMNSSPYNIHHIPMRYITISRFHLIRNFISEIVLNGIMFNCMSRSASEVKEVADVRRSYVRDRYPEIGWNPINKASIYRNPVITRPDPSAIVPKYYYIGEPNLSLVQSI